MGRVGEQMSGWENGWMDGSRDEWICECMNGDRQI